MSDDEVMEMADQEMMETQVDTTGDEDGPDEMSDDEVMDMMEKEMIETQVDTMGEDDE